MAGKLPYSLNFSRLKIFTGCGWTTELLSREEFMHAFDLQFVGIAINYVREGSCLKAVDICASTSKYSAPVAICASKRALNGLYYSPVGDLVGVTLRDFLTNLFLSRI